MSAEENNPINDTVLEELIDSNFEEFMKTKDNSLYKDIPLGNLRARYKRAYDSFQRLLDVDFCSVEPKPLPLEFFDREITEKDLISLERELVTLDTLNREIIHYAISTLKELLRQSLQEEQESLYAY